MSGWWFEGLCGPAMIPRRKTSLGQKTANGDCLNSIARKRSGIVMPHSTLGCPSSLICCLQILDR
jgi:hypothetical protein